MGTHVRVALRILRREKVYAAINIAGLGLAIACCLVVGLLLRTELGYDRHHELHRKIFRVVNEFTLNGNTDRFAMTSQVLGEMLAESYPEIEDYTRFRPASQNRLLIRHETDAYYWHRVYFADGNVFRIFTHDVIYGDPETALAEPNSMAVSRTFARRYFGDENPIGEVLTMDSGAPLRITLVFEDLPQNTHFKYDALLSSNASFLQTPESTTERRQMLFNVGVYTYLVMPEGYDVQAFNRISQDFFDRHMASAARALNASWRAWLEPLADIHFKSDVRYDQPTGNLHSLYGFAAVGVFILLVAAINYVNLATARATKRARAVGVRKVLGVDRSALVLQFLGEAALFSLLATVLGVVLVEVVLTLSPLEGLLGKRLEMDFVGDPTLAAAVLGFGLLLGVLAGIYPAVYLSSWAPLTALLGANRANKANLRFRQALVFVQFAISIAVIASTLLVAEQMRFVSDKSLGFDKENRIVIPLRGVDLIEKMPAVMKDLSTDSRILGMTTSQATMGGTFPISVLQVENNEGVLQPMLVNHMPVDENFLEVMGMELVSGRDFSKRLLTDVGSNVIVNETFVKTMGWDEPLGKRLQVGVNSGQVIGVVRDFNYKSLHTLVEPFAIYLLENDFSSVPEMNRPFLTRQLVVKISGTDVPQTLRLLERKFNEVDPSHPFEFGFLDDVLNEMYAHEQALMSLIGIFGGICILIACLGLFGLAAFTTEQRTKEIGIRKAIGASAAQVIWLLARNVLAIVLASALVGSALAYVAIDRWLEGFAYRAPLNPLVFLSSAAIAVSVALVTIGLQSYGTARKDPVDALRYE